MSVDPIARGTLALLFCMLMVAKLLATIAPVLAPRWLCVTLWFAAELVLMVLLLRLLHRLRPPDPDDFPRPLGQTFELIVVPLVAVYMGVLIAIFAGWPDYDDMNHLGTWIGMASGAALAIAGLVGLVYVVRRRP